LLTHSQFDVRLIFKLTFRYKYIPIKTVEIVIAGKRFQATHLESSERCFITFSSLAQGLGVPLKSILNWYQRVHKDNTEFYTQPIEVPTGKNNTPTNAYSVQLVVEYMQYRATKLKDFQVQALLNTIVEADIIRTIKEAHGITVTAAQHERERERIFIDKVSAILDAHAEKMKEKPATLENPDWLQPTEEQKNTSAFRIACDVAYIQGKQRQVKANLTKKGRVRDKDWADSLNKRILDTMHEIERCTDLNSQEVNELVNKHSVFGTYNI
jgi:hypothetical protein